MGRGLYGLQEPAPPPKIPSRWRWVWRGILIVLALMTASLGTLFLIGGNSADMKFLIEDYLNDASGMTSSIGTLHNFSFYPAMAFDADDIVLSRSGEAGGKAQEMRIGKMRFSIGFWSVARGATKFRVLEFRDVDIPAGIFVPRDLHVDHAGIDQAQSALTAQATYGGAPVELHIDLASRTGLAGIPAYSLAKDSAASLRLGDIIMKGVLNRDGMRGIHLALEELRAGDAAPISGDLTISGAVKGRIKAGASDFTLDVPFSSKDGVWSLRGSISSDHFLFADLSGDKGLVATYGRVRAFIDGPEKTKARHSQPYDFNRLEADIALSFKTFTWSDLVSGPVEAKLAIAKNIATVSPRSPDLNGGTLSGQIRLDATSDPGIFTAQLDLKNFDYTNLQRHVRASGAQTGRADLKIDVQATGNTIDQFWSSLHGGIMAVAGPGELTSSLVNLWGGGLVNAMLPDFERGDHLNLNCGVGSFRVEGPVAKAEAILIDTDTVTIAGEGTVDLRKGTLDLQLDPESKDVAFLSLATSVDVTGPWQKPVIRPQTFSLMTRLGELFFGTINPAFLVFSLTDFGLSEQHPCKAYIKP